MRQLNLLYIRKNNRQKFTKDKTIFNKDLRHQRPGITVRLLKLLKLKMKKDQCVSIDLRGPIKMAKMLKERRQMKTKRLESSRMVKERAKDAVVTHQ